MNLIMHAVPIRVVITKGTADSNQAVGESEAIKAVALATAEAIEKVAVAISQPSGEQAVQLKVAEKAVEAYSKVAADASTTLIVPSNMTEVSTLVSSAMTMIKNAQKGMLGS